MKKKNMMTVLLSMVMAVAMGMTALAATTGWEKNELGWCYWTGDLNEPFYKNGWHWVDGNKDGVGECYYFDQNGFILLSTVTPDGYTVNESGAWVVDGVVQTKQIQAETPAAATDAKDVDYDTESVVQGGYDEYGISLVAIDMIESTREENAAKYTEVSSDNLGLTVTVEYVNGLCVTYPGKGTADDKAVDSTTTEGKKAIFKYYNENITSTDGAADYLHGLGFPDDRRCYSNGTTCWVQGNGYTINWSVSTYQKFSSYVCLRKQSR